jgi:phosphoribosylformylglycinamidine cyclo-ligase
VDPYKKAGVDTEAGARAVELIKTLAEGATRPEVAGGIGGFAGAWRLDDDRLLISATDGVGTKTEVARLMNKRDTVGIDLVAMCVVDVVCVGAEPLFFLDYIAIGQVVPEEVASIVSGVAEGCRQAGCALIGGETAEHPGLMDPDQFDLAGFCVGIVNKDEMLGPQNVREGDLLVGLESSGPHSNGYSMIRDLFLVGDAYSMDQRPLGLAQNLGEALLEPTRIYAPLVLGLAKEGLIRAASHITGGGLYENLPRALPEGLGADVDSEMLSVPPIFDFIQQVSGADRDAMFHTFNMGIGMVLVVPAGQEYAVFAVCKEAGIPARLIGSVIAGDGLTLA